MDSGVMPQILLKTGSRKPFDSITFQFTDPRGCEIPS